MVQTDISQLTGECNQWREHLRTCREEFNLLKNQLQHAVNKQLSKDQLTNLEHYQNQLHIQLINIHDLKQAVKAHDRKINFESTKTTGQIADETYADHEKLFEEYQSLKSSLEDLRGEFGNFITGLQ